MLKAYRLWLTKRRGVRKGSSLNSRMREEILPMLQKKDAEAPKSGTKTMDNNLSDSHTCISDYLMDPESSIEDWRPLFRMASMGLAEVVMEDDDLSIWATQEQMDIFVELDADDIV